MLSTSSSRGWRNRLGATLAMLLACLVSLPAPPTNEPRLLFVHLRFQDGVPVLVKATSAPGRLKPQRGAARRQPLQIVLENARGEALWSLEHADPTVQFHDVPDESQPGGLRRVRVELPEAEFTVRLPWHPEARQLSLVRRTEGPAEATAGVRLGTVLLPPLSEILAARPQDP